MPLKTPWLAALALAVALPATVRADTFTDDALRRAYERPPAQWPAPQLDAGVAFVELGALPPPAATDAREAQLARLGGRLFHDPRLSADGRVACASCHRPAQGWTVRTPLATGVHGHAGTRNPPGLLEVALRAQWGWDGAAASLDAQSLRPFTDPREMGHASVQAAWQRVAHAPDYVGAWRALSPRPSPALLGEALAAFQRTLHAPTAFDRFAQGDHRALGDAAVRGLHLFRTTARCANCHFGPTLSDGRFHNLGIAFIGEPSQDTGRHAVTGRCEDAGRFRTPSLRHVARTAPYMHHGLFDSLAGVLHLYARGGGEPRGRATAQRDPLHTCALRVSPHLRPLDLSEADTAALLAFLKAL
ncbi:MAG: cytochrome-c peroxidase [Hydrogenophaga sp.]|nr:cytochrome-c peroxidase [Hydrogenophaga sp.]